MTNINREALVSEFIENNKILENENYRNLFLYKVQPEDLKEGKKVFLDGCIKYFIETYLFDCNYTGKFNYTSLEDLINDIEDFDLNEIVDGEIDTRYYDLMTSYITFDNWLDITERNELSIIETIQFGQYEAYCELYEAIRSDFVEFLNNK